MKNLKPFNEMRNSNIHTGIELTPRQIDYIFNGIDKNYFREFNILVDDGIFYVKYFREKFEFDRIQDLRDYIHLRYYIVNYLPYKAFEIIKRNRNLDYNFDNSKPIRWSSLYGKTEVVELLLQDDRVDPSANDNLAIIWASEKGHKEVVRLLIQHPKVRASLTKKEIERYEKF